MIRALAASLAILLAAPSFAVAATERLLILGDSLTEGYGVAREEAYPAKLGELLKSEGYGDVEVRSAGVSGATSASGLSRLKWALKSTEKPTALLLELGANDGLRGRKVEETRKDLLSIVELAKSKGLKVMLAGMQLPTNYTAEYRESFARMYSELAKSTGARLLPFLLEGVGGDPRLNLADGIHPNPEGHARVARMLLPHVVKFLKLAKKAPPK